MTPSCSSGKIRRAAYTRKAYTRKDGIRVKGTRVASRCIRDQGKPGKGKRLFTLKKGMLTKYGYSTRAIQAERHSALIRAMKDASTGYIWKRLNAIEILNRNTNPEVAAKIKRDMDWLRAKYGVRNA